MTPTRLVISRAATSRDRGASDAIGLVVLAPVMVGLAVLVGGLGRMVDNRAAVRSAAESGAQAGVLERDQPAQRETAKRVADQMIEHTALCAASRVEVGFSSAVLGGEPTDKIDVTVSCTTDTTGIASLFPARTHVVTVSATLDQHRARL